MVFREPDGGQQYFSFGYGLPQYERRPSEGELELTRKAARLVMDDVEAELKEPGIEVIVGPVEELNDELVRRGRPVFPSAANVYGWVLQGDGGAIGIWHPEDQEWPDLVVSVADIIQEGIIEGTEHWGVAFPMCAVHPNHPMEAQVVNAGAGWVCPKGAGEPVPIGRIRLTKSS